MSDYDNSPALWGNNNFGKINFSGGRGEAEYQISEFDVVMLGAMAGHESAYPYITAWSLIQRFGGRGPRKISSGNDNFAYFVQRFSAPVNPAFAYSGTASPQRAASGTNCAELARYEGLWTGRGAGSLPNFGNRRYRFVPQRSTWNRVMCSGGRSPSTHGNDRKNAARQERFRQIIQALSGPSDDAKNSAWRELTKNTRTRQAIWNVVHGQAGNPIPGFDNWAACGSIANSSNKIIFYQLSVVEQEAAMAAVTERRSLGYVAQRRGRQAIPVKFAERSNCFLYHTIMRPGDEIWMEWDSNERLFDSRRQEVDMSHVGGESVVSSSVRGSSGSQPSTSRGLAPTEQQPASSSTSSRVSVLPSQEELISQLEQWAIDMEATLDQNLGKGFVR